MHHDIPTIHFFVDPLCVDCWSPLHMKRQLPLHMKRWLPQHVKRQLTLLNLGGLMIDVERINSQLSHGKFKRFKLFFPHVGIKTVYMSSQCSIFTKTLYTNRVLFSLLLICPWFHHKKCKHCLSEVPVVLDQRITYIMHQWHIPTYDISWLIFSVLIIDHHCACKGDRLCAWKGDGLCMWKV